MIELLINIQMIDTISLMCNTFKVLDKANLTVVPSNWSYNTGELANAELLWVTDTGIEVRGKKAFVNRENFAAEIIKYPRNPSRLFTRFSFPKVLFSDNFTPAPISRFPEALNRIENTLQSDGIEVSLKQGKLTRIDLFKNINLSEPLSAYTPLLETLPLRRKLPQFRDGSLYWENTGLTLAIYDKKAEMTHRGLDVSHYPAPIARIEARIKNGLSIRNELGFQDYHDLIDRNQVLRDWLKSLMNNLFSVPESQFPEKAEMSLLEIKDFLVGAFSLQKWRGMMEKYLAYAFMTEKFSEKSVFAFLHEEFGKQQARTARRIKAEYLEFRKMVLFLGSTNIKKRSARSLYSEIRQKVLEATHERV